MRNPGQARFAHHGLVLRCLSAAILLNLTLPAKAATTINAGTTTQTLSTDTSYLINNGSVLSATGGNTLIVNGIEPVTLTNDGRLFNANGSFAALQFNVSGTVINQADGAIQGNTFGIQVTAGTVNITNRGDISATSSQPIAYGGTSSGTFDNYGTINNGTIQAISTSPNAISINTTGTVSINNHVGASIKSGVNNPSFGTGIIVPAGTVQLTNDGLIAGYQQGVRGSGTTAIINVVNNSTGVIQGTLKPGIELLNSSSIVNRGLTTVNGGRLNVDGSVAGNVTVATNTTLGGSGAIAGNVTIAGGGHLSPGDSPGTLQVGSLLLDPTSMLDYELGVPNIIGGGVNDLVNVTGNLTLDGTLNIADSGGFGSGEVTGPGTFGPGVYRLFNYGGSFANNGLNLGQLPTGFSPNEMLVQTSVGGQVNLIVQSGGFGNQYWDGPNIAGNGVVNGGTSTWDLLATHWTGADGAVNAPWQSGFAVFQGTAGTVTLGQNIPFSGMQFSTDGYRIAGSGFSLMAAQSTIVNVDPSVNATIDAPLIDGSGATTLNKTGTGTLILTASNTYSGGSVIDGGTLQIGNGGTTGSVLGSLVNNGTLTYFRADPGNTPYPLNESISGAGTVRLMGTGVINQAAYSANAAGSVFPGAVIVEPGARLSLSGSNAAGQTGVAVESGAGLWLQPQASYSSALSLAGTGWNETAGLLGALRMSDGAIASGPLFLTANARIGITLAQDTGTISGIIDDRGLGYALEKAGPGTLILTATNTYTGGTTVTGGTLQIGNAGTTGSIAGDIANNAALVFNRSDALLYGGVISGTGHVTKLSTGLLTLTGDSTYTGGTTISAGTLQLGNGGATGSVVGDIVDNAALVFNRFDNLTYAGAVSGSGSLAQIAAGTLTLTGANSYTGGTTISAGTLQIGAGGTAGSIVGNITDNGALVFNRSDSVTYAGVISGSGSLSQNGTGTLIFTGNSTYAGGTSIHSGSLQIGDGGTSGSIVGDVLDDRRQHLRRWHPHSEW